MPIESLRKPPFFALCRCGEHGWIVTDSLLRIECDSQKEALTSLNTLVRRDLVAATEEERIVREIQDADLADDDDFSTLMHLLGADEELPDGTLHSMN